MFKNTNFLLKTILFLFIITFCFHSKSMAEENITDRIMREQLENLNIRELELILDDIVKSTDDCYPKINIKDSIISLLRGDNPLDFRRIRSFIIKVFFLK